MSQESTSFSVHGFAESQISVQLINSLSADQRLGNASFLTKMGGIPAANETYAKIPTPNILILETSQPRDVLFNQLDSLAENCDEGTQVFIILTEDDSEMREELLGMGISAVFPMPVNPQFLTAELLKIIPETKPKPSKAGVTSIMSSRPGAGGSTIAHNLAWVLGVERNEPTVLLDLDIAFGTVGLNYFRDPVETVETAMAEAERGAISGRYLRGLCVNIEANLNIITSPSNVYLNNEIKPNAFEQIYRALCDEFQNVIIDLPAEWTSLVKNTLIGSSQIVLVGSPDLASLRNSKNISTFLTKNNRSNQIHHVILNRVGESKRKEISQADFEDSLEIPVAISVPYDAASTSHMELNGEMPLEQNGSSAFSKRVRSLANLVANKSAVRFEEEEDGEELASKSPIVGLIKKFANR